MQASSLSNFDRKWYKENRLYPKKCDEYWSITSEIGYLKLGNSLSKVSEENRKILNTYKVSYKTLGEKLQEHIQFPHRFEKKFKQKLNENCQGMQVCPFSPKHARHGSYSYTACHFSSTQVRIENIRLKRWIIVEGIIPHLIEFHHFIPDYLSVKDLIEVLEILPDLHFRFIKAPKWEESLSDSSSESSSSESSSDSSCEVIDLPDQAKEKQTNDCECIIS